jgi:tetratricopeptide (TPR) repeat protein
MTFALLLAALLARPAAAQNFEGVRIDHQSWRALGWNDACSVALEVLTYPQLGDAIATEPISTRVGRMTVPTGRENAATSWTYQADGVLTWRPATVAKVERELRAAGYDRAGFAEMISTASSGVRPEIDAALFSTATLKSRTTTPWPGPGWRWTAADFNPLSTCALLAFESLAAPRRWRFRLVRVYNPRVRLDRAYAHAENARLLLNAGDLDAGFAEAETAAALAPELGIARYTHAALLCLTGRMDAAVAELAAAIKIDPSFRARARRDADFGGLRDRQDFRELVRRRRP